MCLTSTQGQQMKATKLAMPLVRFLHRRSSYKELHYICDGDSNGVLYFAGQSYGEHQWVNPILAKRVSIIASSSISRFTDPKDLASRTSQLMCNYYTLRQDGSIAFIRNWNLQASTNFHIPSIYMSNPAYTRIYSNFVLLIKQISYSFFDKDQSDELKSNLLDLLIELSLCNECSLTCPSVCSWIRCKMRLDFSSHLGACFRPHVLLPDLIIL